MQETKQTDHRRASRSLYWQGWTITSIAEHLEIPRTTVDSWRQRDKWDKAPVIERVETSLEARLVQLIAKEIKTGSDYKEIDLLTRQMERLARIRRYEAPGGNETDLNPNIANRSLGRNRKKQKNHFTEDQVEKLKKTFRDSLFLYQTNWWLNRDNRTRAILKSRQIGATWYFAREALMDAVLTGSNQIFLSASRAQAHVFRQYIVQFVKDAVEIDPFNPLPGLASQINPFAFQKEKIHVDKKGLTYYKEPGAYFLYTFQEPFHEKARHFRAARSDDFKNASIENPGYLPVKLIGEEIIEDWSSTLGTTGIGKLFYKGGKLFLKEGKLVRNVGKFLGVATAIQIDYARQYHTFMDKWMNKSEEEMWKNEAYREMRRQNIPDHEARFYVARAHARKESGKWVLFSLLKKGMAHYLLKSTRTGEEGGPLKYAQDKFLNKTIDSVADEGIDWIKGKARGNNQEEEK